MKLAFIYGIPATGKLTVAKELATLTGYKLFHNHLVVDLLLEVFEFGSESFVALREKMWLNVFRAASQSGFPGLIFTFAPEKTVSQQFIENTVSQAKAAGDELTFVELFCEDQQIERRLAAEDRQRYKKLASVDLWHELKRKKTFDHPKMPQPQLRIDTGQHSAKQAAMMIARHLGLEKKSAEV